MAFLVPGVNRGTPPYQIQGATGVAPIRFGESASATNVGSTQPQQVVLPVDVNGLPYAAFQITASGAVWFCFNSGAGAATIGGAHCYLITVGSQETVVPPYDKVGAASLGISVIGDTGVTNASFCIIGLF
jgi:hypothetical protein